jgi:hypothetical protein
MASDRLYYCGTETAVQIGDLVEVKRGWFGRYERGRVCYLPGISKPHPEMERDGTAYWAIELEDGTVVSWIYLPERIQPGRRIRFIARGSQPAPGLSPTDVLE